MEKKGKPNLHIVPPDPFENPIPWLERAAEEIEKEERGRRKQQIHIVNPQEIFED
jgi:hypothetical protein